MLLLDNRLALTTYTVWFNPSIISMCCKSSLPGGSRGKSRAHTGTHTGDLNQWRTPITGASREIQVVKDPCPKAFCRYCNYRTCEQDSRFLSSWTGIILFFKFSKKQKSWRQLWGRELRQWELDSTLIRTAASQAWVYRLGLFFFFLKRLSEKMSMGGICL